MSELMKTDPDPELAKFVNHNIPLSYEKEIDDSWMSLDIEKKGKVYVNKFFIWFTKKVNN